MKKMILKIISISIFFVLSLFLFVGCISQEQQENLSPSKTNDFYGLGAVSTVNLLSNNSSIGKNTREESTNDFTGYVDKFNEYFKSFDFFSGENPIETTTEKNTDENFPYEVKMTIKGRDMIGQETIHILYYTETFVRENKDDDEITKIYELAGTMLENDVQYYLRGNRKIESDADEEENEIWIRAYKNKNDLNTYVEMEQETSVETKESENEYTYRIIVDGVLKEETSVEFETEEKFNKNHIEYEIEFLNGSGKGKYTVEAVVEGEISMIKVRYNIDGVRGEFVIKKNKNSNDQQEYEYIFPTNNKSYN